jgi:hypothetical protein
MKFKALAFSAFLAAPLIGSGAMSVYAQSSAGSNHESSALVEKAQSLGARARAEITRLGIHNTDTARALKFQSDGDQALRDNDPVRASEDYGRAEEAVSVLDRERINARDARTKTDDELRRAQREGGNIADAENYSTRGDQALETGNYHTAEVYYAEARAQLNRSATR